MDYCKRIHARTDKCTRHTYTHFAQFATTADKKRGLEAEDDSSEWSGSATATAATATSVATAAIATVAVASAVLLLVLYYC